MGRVRTLLSVISLYVNSVGRREFFFSVGMVEIYKAYLLSSWASPAPRADDQQFANPLLACSLPLFFLEYFKASLDRVEFCLIWNVYQIISHQELEP